MMTTPEQHRFDIDSSLRWTLVAGIVIFAGFALLGGLLPFLPDDGPKNHTATLVVAVVSLFGFGTAAWYCARAVRQLPSLSVVADEDGLWPANQRREVSLVKWSNVVRLRERRALQRLELLDGSGSPLIKLEYQLRDFSRLRSMVIERANLTTVQSAIGAIVARSVWHHIFSMASIVGFVALGLYAGITQPLLGYGGMGFVVAFIIWEYFTTIHSLSVDDEHLQLQWPLRRYSLSRADIQAIELADDFANNARHPCVILLREPPAKPIRLRGLGVSVIELHRMLLVWKRDAA